MSAGTPMATVRTARPRFETFADLFRAIGEVPLDRIRMHPPPGKATEKDVIAIREGPERRLCELVDGVLVEKAMGTRESRLALVIGGLMDRFVTRRDLGIVLGADGMLRPWPGQVRIPDVSFISWERLPNEELPDAPVAALVPDLAVEVLSRGNTKKEIDRKLRDY